MLGLFVSTIIVPCSIIARFYLNQNEIIAKYCINKNKPEKNCNGHCYLNNELKSISNLNIDVEKNEINFSFFFAYAYQDLFNIELSFIEYKIKNIFNYFNFYSYLREYSFLDPPKLYFLF